MSNLSVKKGLNDLLKKIDTSVEKVDKNESVSLDQIEKTSARYAAHKPVTLAAISGGTLGAIGGIAIPSVFLGVATTSLALTGPLGLALGAALFAFGYKMKYNHKTIVNTENYQTAFNTLSQQLENPNLSEDLKEEINQQLKVLVRRYNGAILNNFEPPRTVDIGSIEDAEVIE